jgi:hypothetical protein
VVAGYLREPRAERHGLVLLAQYPVKFQKDLCGGILSVFALTKIPPADLQNVAIVSSVTLSQKFGADWSQ